MRRQLAIALGLSLVLPLLALRGWIALQRGDAAAPDDGDLHAPLAAITHGENGFAQLSAAAETAILPKGEQSWDRFHAVRMGAGASADAEWIGELAARNAPAIALLRSGIAAPQLRLPIASDADPARVLARLHPLVAIAGAEARLRARRGDASAAIELGSLGLIAAHRLSNAENARLASVALAASFASASLADLDFIVRATRITPELAREMAALLEANRWTPDAWRAVWAHEYARAQSGFSAVPATAHTDAATASGVPQWAMRWVPLDYLWQPNRTQAALADVYRDQQHKSALFCAEAKLVPARTARTANPARLARLLAPNAVGDLILELRPPFDDIQRRRCHFESTISLVQVLAAVKAHWDAQDALPERLGDLVPRYLDSLPLDRFDGLPIRYSRAGAKISSVGDDLVSATPLANAALPRLSDAPEPALSVVF